jgi:hypothetical protein
VTLGTSLVVNEGRLSTTVFAAAAIARIAGDSAHLHPCDKYTPSAISQIGFLRHDSRLETFVGRCDWRTSSSWSTY